MRKTLGGQRPGFSTERLEELRELQTMMKTYRNYGDGVQYLRGLEHAAAGPVPRIDFVHATMMARHRARPMLREPVPGLCTNALGPTLRTDCPEMMYSHPAKGNGFASQSSLCAF